MTIRQLLRALFGAIGGLICGYWVADGFAVHGRAAFAVVLGFVVASAVVFSITDS